MARTERVRTAVSGVSGDYPAPVPPSPPPISPGQKWYGSATFLTWLGYQVLSIAALIAFAVGHPLPTDLLNGIVSATAMLVSGITTTVFVHGQNKLAQMKLGHAQSLQYEHYHAALVQKGFAQP